MGKIDVVVVDCNSSIGSVDGALSERLKSVDDVLWQAGGSKGIKELQSKASAVGSGNFEHFCLQVIGRFVVLMTLRPFTTSCVFWCRYKR